MNQYVMCAVIIVTKEIRRGGMDISMGALFTGILGPGPARSMHRVIVITIILQATGGGEGRRGIEVGREKEVRRARRTDGRIKKEDRRCWRKEWE